MKEKLYPFHVGLLVFMIQSGVVVFTLPRLLAQYMGYNGWITLVLFGGIATINILLISFVYRLSHGKSIFQIIEHAMPKIVFYPIYLGLIIVWTMLGCLVAKQYVIIFQVFVFPTTHPMFIKILVDILTFILIIKGIYNISKAATIFFWMVIWTLALLLYFLSDFQWVNFTPFFLQESTDVVTGGLKIFTAFLGYELVLLLFPYADKKGFIKAVYAGNIVTVFSYLSVSLICFGFYSFVQLKKMKYPLIDLLSYIKLPFVERIENIIFALFLFTTMISITMYIWASTETAIRLLPRANKKWLSGILIIIAFVVSWVPDVLSEVEMWLQLFTFIEIGIAFGLPILLIIILMLSKGEESNA